MKTLQLNGRDASGDDVRALAALNYGHFTSMRVQGGAVQGLSLHHGRLQAATAELFGTTLDIERVSDCLRQALRGRQDAWLRVTVFSRDFDFRATERALETDVLVSVAPPLLPLSRPLRLRTVDFIRPLWHLKHVGTLPQFHHRRQARLAGFDDALFVDDERGIAEGTLWNIGFWTGDTVVWPDAPALAGVTAQLITGALTHMGIPQARMGVNRGALETYVGAFACNAAGLQEVSEIDGALLPASGPCRTLAAEALAAVPWDRI
ncbi:aminotransferase class IV family protein [soil metagenome]